MSEPIYKSIKRASHWRVNLRPETYTPELIPTLGGCIELIEKTKVSLRGWDYPHLSNRQSEQGRGTNWVESWSDFRGRKEFWRFYQSGQFIHLFTVKETAPEWRSKLEEDTRFHLGDDENIDWSRVPGFISIINFLYTVTEIFEFATRLCQAGVYKGLITISIQLNGINQFVLTTDTSRSWHNYYAATQDTLGKPWSLSSNELVANSAELSLQAIKWFFERFGWLNPPMEVLKNDQENFLKRRI